MSIAENLINEIEEFIDGCFICFDNFLDFVINDESGVMITFVVAFPLCFLGIWIIKKLIRVKDT